MKYTIREGVIYDAKKLLSKVKEIVEEEKKIEGFKIKQPGIN